jgi:hypothetical protein
VQFVRDRQKACPTSLTILMGDFNSAPRTALIQFVKESFELIGDESEPTLPSDHDGQAKCLDYIFMSNRSQHWQVESSGVCFKERNPMLSDHFGVECVLRESADLQVPLPRPRYSNWPNVQLVLKNGVDRAWRRVWVHLIRAILCFVIGWFLFRPLFGGFVLEVREATIWRFEQF